MRTEDFISALAADQQREQEPSRRLIMSALAGLLASCVIFFPALGIRPDIGPALMSWRFDLKIALLLAAVGLTIAACQRAALPFQASATHAIWFIPLALIAASAVELMIVPSSQWMTRLVGTNAVFCLTAIPILSIAPLAFMLSAMRNGAPAQPAAAGALAGLTSAAVAAALYGLHCFDDSPLFVATWYTLASLPAIIAGAFVGSRLLRW